MTGCGYTPNEIDHLTIQEVRDLFSYWNNFPPTHELMKLYIGYKPTEANGAVGSDTITQEDMIARLNAAGGKIVRNIRNG